MTSPPAVDPPSFQSLLLQMRFSGTTLAHGTGFVCDTSRGPHLVTNWHNLAGRNPLTKQPLSPMAAIPNEVVIAHNRRDQLGAWVPKVEPLHSDGEPRWIEHPRFRERVDVVALPLTQLDDVAIHSYAPPTDPRRTIVVGPAEAVSVVGFPFGLTAGGVLAIWATGFVASEPELDFEGLPQFLIDCRSRQGQSGSPVIAHRTESARFADGSMAHFVGSRTTLLGVYSGRIHKDSDIGRVWKVSALQELLASVT